MLATTTDGRHARGADRQRDPRLVAAVQTKGPHDLRHTFATWLEDAGIPARVIDEVMGHAGGRRGEHHGSRIGSVYRHTTPAMEQRIRDEINKRLVQASEIASKPEVAAAIEANRADRLRPTAHDGPRRQRAPPGSPPATL